MAAPTFTLAPAAQDRSVSFTISKELDPYVVAWFNDKKQVGETPNDFFNRLIQDQSLRHREVTLCQSVEETFKTDEATSKQGLLDDCETVQAEKIVVEDALP